MPTLSDKLRNAPEGSRLREILFEDSSSSEDGEVSEYDGNNESSEDEELSMVEITTDTDEVLEPKLTDLNCITPISKRGNGKKKGKSINIPTPSLSCFNEMDHDTTPPTPPSRTHAIIKTRSSEKKKHNKNNLPRKSNVEILHENSTLINVTPSMRVSLSPTTPKSTRRSPRARDTISSLEALSYPVCTDKLPLKKRKLQSSEFLLDAAKVPSKKVKSSSNKANKVDADTTLKPDIVATEHLETTVELKNKIPRKKKKSTKANKETEKTINSTSEIKNIEMINLTIKEDDALKSNETNETNPRYKASAKKGEGKEIFSSDEVINSSFQEETVKSELVRGRKKKGRPTKKKKGCNPTTKEDDALKSNEMNETNPRYNVSAKKGEGKEMSSDEKVINSSFQEETAKSELGKGRTKKGRPTKKKKECMQSVSKENVKHASLEGNVVTTSEATCRGEKSSDLSRNMKATLQPKKKKRTFQDRILAEMLFSCKAYSLKSLATAMKTTECALGHLMLSLLDKKIVMKKEFGSKSGKTREIYWINQDSKRKEVEKLIPSMNDIATAQKELMSLKTADKGIIKEMSAITQELSNNELDSQLLDLESEVKKLKSNLTDVRERIQEFQSQPPPQQMPRRKIGFRKTAQKTKSELARERCPRRLKMRINFQRSQWKQRKEKCVDFIDQLSDAMEKQPKQIIKLLDLETDEMEGVKMPLKYTIEAAAPN